MSCLDCETISSTTTLDNAILFKLVFTVRKLRGWSYATSRTSGVRACVRVCVRVCV